MAEENPIDSGVDKQKVIQQITESQAEKVSSDAPTQIGNADSQVTTKKLVDIVEEARVTRKRPEKGAIAAPAIPQPTLWESVKAYRNEVSTLVTLAIGT